MENRVRKNGLLMATPTEEAEAERLLAAGRQQTLEAIGGCVNALRESLAHRQYHEALHETLEMVRLVVDLERVYG